MENLKELKKRILSNPFFVSPFYLKYNRLIVPGIVLVIALLILSLVTMPQVFKLFETYKSIDELNQKKAFYLRKISELQNLNLPQTRQELETALVALPVDRDIPGVTGELLVALSGSGMSLNAINFSATSPESEKVQEYSIKMEISGTQSNLKNFLERVKVSPRLIKLSSLDISKNNVDSLSASVGFVTLYQMLPQNIGSVDEDVPQISQDDRQVLSDIRTKVNALPKETAADASTSAIGKLNPFSD